ncbi:MAG: quinolinate synthase NadA [Thermoplasmata archaeon]
MVENLEDKKKEEIVNEIKKLKEEKKVVILAHYYQRGEVQDIADYVGDSLGLSIQASKTDAKIILFCGVDFMAESAKILNPKKKVVIPTKEATCPMAMMVDAEGLRELKSKEKGVPVVAYVNTTAEVKAEADICCTSSNAIDIVNSLKEDRIIFVPDTNLGAWVKHHTKKEIILWPGYCPTHQCMTLEMVNKLKNEHPNAEVLVHPECPLDVSLNADKVASTDGMVKYVASSKSVEFIVGTECGLEHALKKRYPDKKFYFLGPECPNMKKITLPMVLDSIKTEKEEVKLNKKILELARVPLQRMIDFSTKK